MTRKAALVSFSCHCGVIKKPRTEAGLNGLWLEGDSAPAPNPDIVSGGWFALVLEA